MPFKYVMRHDHMEILSDRTIYGFLYPHAVCKDGFEVSIQASHGHYCEPRSDDEIYEAVELGFPSERPPDYIMEYAEEPDSPTATVYAFVPAELVHKMIQEHGGLV